MRRICTSEARSERMQDDNGSSERHGELQSHQRGKARASQQPVGINYTSGVGGGVVASASNEYLLASPEFIALLHGS